MRNSIVLLWCTLMLGISVVVPAPVGGMIQGRDCPHCGHHQPCSAVPETLKEKKHCWEVECKNICIPAIRWPWVDRCQPPHCGTVKTVKVLKKVEYECEKCGYKWEAPCVRCPCGK